MQQLTVIKRVRVSKESSNLLDKLRNQSKFMREAIEEKLQRDFYLELEKLNKKKEIKLPF